MLGLGFGEIILILIVALLVLGPEKLPQLARQVGKGLREFRRLANDFQHNLNEIEQETRQALDTQALDTSVAPPSAPAPASDAAEQPEAVEQPDAAEQPAPSQAPTAEPALSHSTREPGTQAPMERAQGTPSGSSPESGDEREGSEEEGSEEEGSPKAGVNLAPSHTVARDDN